MSVTEPKLTQAYLDEFNGDQLRTTCIIFIVLDTLCVALRFWSRHYQKAPFGWDDYLIIPAWISTMGVAIDGLLSYRWGVGYHIQRVVMYTPGEISNWGKNGFYAVPIMYQAAVTWPKLSILVLYLRLFTDKFSRVCCWTLAAILSICAVVNIFTVAFQCNPLSKSWNPEMPGGHCNNIEAHFIYASIPNIATDVAMILLPIPVVWKLQVARHVKLGLLMTFLVAGIGLITSIIRFVEFFMHKFASDGTWFATTLILWVLIEPSMYLISACLLTYRPILVRIVHDKHLSMFYSWVWNTGSYATVDRQHKGATVHPHSDLKKSGFRLGRITVPSTANATGNSADAFKGQGEYYNLEPEMPGKIHVREQFGLGSQNESV